MNDETLNAVDCENRCKSMKLPTEDELKALNRLREIKNRVRELKKKMALMNSDSFYEERSRSEGELIELKKEWEAWEKKRDEAARERMVSLGHLEP